MKKLAYVMFALASTHSMAGEETVIELSSVPTAIMDLAKDAMPDARYVSANTELENNGETVYELQGVMNDGRKFEIDILEGPEIEEIEVEFPRALVPGAVIKAVLASYPNFVFETIEASMSASKKVMKYEVVGKQGDTALDLEVSASGRTIVESDS